MKKNVYGFYNFYKFTLSGFKILNQKFKKQNPNT